MDIQRMIYAGFDSLTPARRTFLHKAFHTLPPLDHPQILDLGCGRGAPTLELARLSGGEIIAIDTDAEALAALAASAASAGLGNRIHVRKHSIDALDFAQDSFDIIWAEASIHAIGFEEGLRDWRRMLKPDGFLVIHEMAWLRPDPPAEIAAYWMRFFPGIRTVDQYTSAIRRLGYRVLDAFALPKDFWWQNYFHPLELRLQALNRDFQGNDEALAALRPHQREVDLCRQYPDWYGSAYLVMQKDRGLGKEEET